MINTPLADLDELVLMCRDEKARSYIAESVASYRAGAHRAAIVGAWIAVCFDIIDKLRELALSGDKEAEVQTNALERIRASGDVGNALKFEKSLLELARDKFELISHLEHIDLERLQADRNRCAHPSLVSDDQIYTPSPELVRAHIHAAVHHLLQHAPSQGKHALDRLTKELDSELFPSNEKKIAAIFSSGPLRKPRDSLVRNFSLLLLKRVLSSNPDIDGGKIYHARSALSVVLSMHRPQVEKLLKERLSKSIRELEDFELGRSIKFLEGLPESWIFIETDVRLRLEAFVSNLPTSSFIDLDFLLEFPPLKGFAESRVKYATLSDLTEDVFFVTPVQVVDRAIAIYLSSTSFEKANDGAKFLNSCVTEMSEKQILKIISGAAKNKEVLGSFGLSGLIKKLKTGKLGREEFNSQLVANGLEKFADIEDNMDDDIPY